MSKPVNQLERRLHPRFPIRAYAQLHRASQQWEAHLLDMSVSGAKLALLEEHPLTCGDTLTLTVTVEPDSLLGSNPQVIQLQGKLIHLCEHLLGVEYQPVSDADKNALARLLSAYSH